MNRDQTTSPHSVNREKLTPIFHLPETREFPLGLLFAILIAIATQLPAWILLTPKASPPPILPTPSPSLILANSIPPNILDPKMEYFDPADERDSLPPISSPAQYKPTFDSEKPALLPIPIPQILPKIPYPFVENPPLYSSAIPQKTEKNTKSKLNNFSVQFKLIGNLSGPTSMEGLDKELFNSSIEPPLFLIATLQDGRPILISLIKKSGSEKFDELIEKYLRKSCFTNQRSNSGLCWGWVYAIPVFRNEPPNKSNNEIEMN
ncbi:MAG: TonB C-terminal domain-containing protein [Chthoniobacterales bacterium]|nr:TonB C-terminal domain-containing protein [Chthoniobacterales bacterium]